MEIKMGTLSAPFLILIDNSENWKGSSLLYFEFVNRKN